MKIVYLNPDNISKWDKFCFEHEEAWLWHTTEWITCCEDSRFGVKTENCSFMVLEGEKIFGIVPLMVDEYIDTSGITREFTFNGGPTPYYLLDYSIGKRGITALQEFIWEEIKMIAQKRDVERIWMRANVHNPDFIYRQHTENPLIKMGFLDTSIYSCVMAIDKSESELLSEMRKGHRSAVIKSIKRLNFHCYDKETISNEKINQFRDMYFLVAGKVTRPQRTFDMLFNLISNGKGLLFEAMAGDDIIGYVYVTLYKQYAYYGMSCVLNQYKSENVTHFLQWNAIKRLKREGIHYYELGEQYYDSTLVYPASEKLKSISLFKRGFGGNLILQFSGEYFFSSEYFKELYTRRIGNYKNEKWSPQNT